jgi:hypothetical protein
MKRFATLALAAAILAGGTTARASDEATFLSALRRYGVSPEAPKKPCLCVGGPVDRMVGWLRAAKTASGFYKYECDIEFYSQDGHPFGGMLCLANGGTSVVQLTK